MWLQQDLVHPSNNHIVLASTPVHIPFWFSSVSVSYLVSGSPPAPDMEGYVWGRGKGEAAGDGSKESE